MNNWTILVIAIPVLIAIAAIFINFLGWDWLIPPVSFVIVGYIALVVVYCCKSVEANNDFIYYKTEESCGSEYAKRQKIEMKTDLDVNGRWSFYWKYREELEK